MISADKLTDRYEDFVAKLSHLDGIPLLLIRLILAPIMVVAGYNKLRLGDDSAAFPNNLLADPNIVSWFGNPDWGLGLPFPDLLGFLAGWTEFLGGWFLLIGLLTRLWSIPLAFTMLVAIFSAHWQNGWYAVAPSNSETSPTLFFQWLGFESADKAADNAKEVKYRLNEIEFLIKNSENPQWVTEKGSVVILNNGIEFAATYLVMLLVLLFFGGGRYISLDYYVKQTLFK